MVIIPLHICPCFLEHLTELICKVSGEGSIDLYFVSLVPVDIQLVDCPAGKHVVFITCFCDLARGRTLDLFRFGGIPKRKRCFPKRTRSHGMIRKIQDSGLFTFLNDVRSSL